MIEALGILTRSPVIPVTTMQRTEDAVAIGEALLAGGVDIIEVTLRSAAGLGAIESLRKHCPALCVGAGTIWTADEARAAARAGAEFLVSPGIADAVFDACVELALPYLPGAQTVSEIAHLHGRGALAVKFFPASAAGGVAALKSFSAVFPGVAFCPTGGITAQSAPAYLELDCVPCVGGGWLTSDAALAARDWPAVRAAAAEAAALASR